MDIRKKLVAQYLGQINEKKSKSKSIKKKVKGEANHNQRRRCERVYCVSFFFFSFNVMSILRTIEKASLLIMKVGAYIEVDNPNRPNLNYKS